MASIKLRNFLNLKSVWCFLLRGKFLRFKAEWGGRFKREDFFNNKQTRFEKKMVESAGSLQAVALLIDELNS